MVTNFNPVSQMWSGLVERANVAYDVKAYTIDSSPAFVYDQDYSTGMTTCVITYTNEAQTATNTFTNICAAVTNVTQTLNPYDPDLWYSGPITTNGVEVFFFDAPERIGDIATFLLQKGDADNSQKLLPVDVFVSVDMTNAAGNFDDYLGILSDASTNYPPELPRESEGGIFVRREIGTAFFHAHESTDEYYTNEWGFVQAALDDRTSGNPNVPSPDLAHLYWSHWPAPQWDIDFASVVLTEDVLGSGFIWPTANDLFIFNHDIGKWAHGDWRISEHGGWHLESNDTAEAESYNFAYAPAMISGTGTWIIAQNEFVASNLWGAILTNAYTENDDNAWHEQYTISPYSGVVQEEATTGSFYVEPTLIASNFYAIYDPLILESNTATADLWLQGDVYLSEGLTTNAVGVVDYVYFVTNVTEIFTGLGTNPVESAYRWMTLTNAIVGSYSGGAAVGDSLHLRFDGEWAQVNPSPVTAGAKLMDAADQVQSYIDAMRWTDVAAITNGNTNAVGDYVWWGFDWGALNVVTNDELPAFPHAFVHTTTAPSYVLINDAHTIANYVGGIPVTWDWSSIDIYIDWPVLYTHTLDWDWEWVSTSADDITNALSVCVGGVCATNWLVIPAGATVTWTGSGTWTNALRARVATDDSVSYLISSDKQGLVTSELTHTFDYSTTVNDAAPFIFAGRQSGALTFEVLDHQTNAFITLWQTGKDFYGQTAAPPALARAGDIGGNIMYQLSVGANVDMDELVAWSPESAVSLLPNPTNDTTDTTWQRLGWLEEFGESSDLTSYTNGAIPIEEIPYGSGTTPRGWAMKAGTWVLKWDGANGWEYK